MDILRNDDHVPPDPHRGIEGAVVGIDLGTTNSVIATVIDGRVQALADESGSSLHPSVVAFLPTGDRLIGPAAVARRAIDPANTIFSAKRLIGQPYRAPAVQEVLAHLPYRVEEGPDQESIIVTRAGKLRVPEISGLVLAHLRELAQRRLGTPVNHCVITVPANFSDGQREATRQAAGYAGMEVLRVLNEPTAAALAYGHERKLHQRVAIFDFGGGTFDLTLLAVREDLYEVVATGGDPFLGGDDMDQVLARRLARMVLERHRSDPTSDPSTFARLLMAAEQIKIRLSRDEIVQGTLTEVGFGPGGQPLSLDFRIVRDELDILVAGVVERALAAAARVMAEAQVDPSAVDEVILVGGATRVPLVRKRVTQQFGRAPLGGINPMEVVACGAALHAHGLFAPPGTRAAEVGLLLDVTSHSLGVATAGGYADVLVAKNTGIPAERSRIFSTAQDNQQVVVLRVCQGESRRFDENQLLGELRLTGLRAAPRGVLKIEVTFLIDADGILQVSARDIETGRAEAATLKVLGVGSR